MAAAPAIKVASIRGNAAAAGHYRQSARDIARQALKGGGPLLQQLLMLRDLDYQRLRKDAALRAYFQVSATELAAVRARTPGLAGQLRIEAADLVHFGGCALPMIKEPEFLDASLDSDVVALIEASACLAPFRQLAPRFLAEAAFNDGDRRYRTEFAGGTPRIHGERKNTIRALAAIAHELGHCLSEFGRISIDAPALAASEALAHLLEEECVAEYFANRDARQELAAWRAYQRKIDGLNLLVFELEHARLDGRPASAQFGEYAEALREPLFTMVGYQVVYAEASLRRLRNLIC